MYDLIAQELAHPRAQGRIRTRRVEGVRRSARLISLEIRRSRRAGHSV